MPKEVSQIINYIDLPDYIFYSIDNKKVILAGENTETASVGNSQWQREGRKLGAAKIGVPFIYQTFYSGRDESQDTIREPSSLQVYNQIVYSVRYKTPSFVAYFENNFGHSQTRRRNPIDCKDLFIEYIQSVLLVDSNPNNSKLMYEFEKKFYKHMIDYLREPKSIDLAKHKSTPRLHGDLPCLKPEFYDELLYQTDKFVDELVSFIHESDCAKIEKYINTSKLLSFNEFKFENWTSYSTKNNIKDIIDYLVINHAHPKSYVKGSSKVGFVSTRLCNDFLTDKFPSKCNEITSVLNSSIYQKCILMPLRIHKVSNGSLTFSPDPESGEIVAFAELFSFDLRGKKIKPVIGYCIVDTPRGFDINEKVGTKLYKALAEYIDILIIDNKKLYKGLPNSFNPSNHIPTSIFSTNPLGLTEEMAVVSTYLNQSTINSKWELCFIHTHHSSWQQLVVFRGNNAIQEKVDRVSTKVDLIMQDNNKFMIAEGKNNFQDLLSDNKIQKAMLLASEKIDELYKSENKQFDAFIYNLHTTPTKNPEFYVDREAVTVKSGMNMGHFNDIAHHSSYVVIIVYVDSSNKTKFKLVYSPKFDFELKKQLDKEFEQ